VLKQPTWLGWLMRATAVALALYVIAPWNIAIPVLGIADDLVLVSLLLHALVKLLPAHVQDGFGRGQIPVYNVRH
jgi:uncharacterized membrane protein YkvA (DUF1232 family)